MIKYRIEFSWRSKQTGNVYYNLVKIEGSTVSIIAESVMAQTAEDILQEILKTEKEVIVVLKDVTVRCY